MQSDITNISHNSIDNVLSMYKNESVPLFTDTRETFKQRLTSDCRRVRDLRKEKADLADAYNRYVSIQAELKQKEKNIDRLMAILGDSGFAEARREDKSKAIEQVAERHLSEQLPLWEAVQIYLDVTGEAKMMDVLLFLRWYAVDASREAVESALRTHKDVFQTRKVGREKFISLKGA